MASADPNPSRLSVLHGIAAALEDRVCTACELYRQGYARKLVFSGGRGEGAISEPQCMRRFAMSLGVADADIVLDEGGLNTQKTVENTVRIFERLRASRVLAVSHAYHLPRVNMTYARAGREIYTVPAKETYLLSAMPYLMAREVAGLWAYYLRPLAGG